MNFGRHLSWCLGKAWRGDGICTTTRLDHGLVGFFPTIIGVWMGIWVDLEASWVLVPILWEEVGKNGGNEGDFGGEFEKISLLDVYDSYFLVFFQKLGRGNSNGGTPSFSLWEWVRIRAGWQDEDTLPSDVSNRWAFYRR